MKKEKKLLSVRQAAVRRLIWQAIIIVVSTLLFQSLLAPAIILYLIRTINLVIESTKDAEFSGETRYYKSFLHFLGEELIKAVLILLIPLLPAIIIAVVFPQYSWVAGVIGFMAFALLVLKPIANDIVKAISNSEAVNEKFDMIITGLSVLVVIGLIIYMVVGFFLPEPTPKIDHIAVWNEYAAENGLGEEYATYIENQEPSFLVNKSNDVCRVYNGEIVKEKSQGFVDIYSLMVEYKKNSETEEWEVSTYEFEPYQTKIVETVTWTGTEQGNTYTFSLNAGNFTNTTGHLTIKGSDGYIIDTDFAFGLKSNGNYIVETEQDIGWSIFDFQLKYNEETDTFESLDDRICKTLSR